MENRIASEQVRYVRNEFLKNYMDTHSVAESHLHSYNRSLEVDIPNIIKRNACIKTKYEDFYIFYSVLSCTIERPEHHPLHCQETNTTYSGEISATLVRHVYTRSKEEVKIEHLYYQDAKSNRIQSSTRELAHKKNQVHHPPGLSTESLLGRKQTDVSLQDEEVAGNDDLLAIPLHVRNTITPELIEDAKLCHFKMKARDRCEFRRLVSSVKYEKVKITDWPVMVRSKLCLLNSKQGHFSMYPDTEKSKSFDDYNRRDQGGYFIINGKPRFIPLMKSVASNIVLCFYVASKKRWIVQVRAQSEKRQFQSTHTLELYVDIQQKISRKTTIAFAPMVSIPYFSKPVPLRVLHMAMGKSVEDFWNDVKALTPTSMWDEEKFQKYYNGLLFSNLSVNSKQSAISFLGSRYGRYQSDNAGYSAIFCEVLPNLNPTEERFDVCSSSEYDARQEELNMAKLQHLALCLSNLMLCAEGKMPSVDKDSRSVVRLVDSGTSMSVLLRMQLCHLMGQSLKILRRFVKEGKDVELAKIYNHTRLGEKILQSVATGTWTSMRRGVCQSFNTNNQAVIQSQLRRISSTVGEGSHIPRRMLHFSSLGYECASETPEGRSCGLVGQLACTARVTLHFDGDCVVDSIKRFFVHRQDDLPYGTFVSSVQMPKENSAQRPRDDHNKRKRLETNKRHLDECMCISAFRRMSASQICQGSFIRMCSSSASNIQMETHFEQSHVCRCLVPTPLSASGTRDWWKILGPSGSSMGWTCFPWLVRELLREARRLGIFQSTTAISVDPTFQVIKLDSDSGRLCRPLFCAEWLSQAFLLSVLTAELKLANWLGCSPTQTVSHLLNLGAFEYVTPAEEKNLRPTFDWRLCLSTRNTATHLEITNVSILGKLGARIPLPSHSQGPRLAYGLGMMKQAIVGNSVDRGSNRSYRLLNPQRPLISTAFDIMDGGSNSTEFTNVVMAVMAMPSNQEDAIIVNRSFLNMGAFAFSSDRWHVSEIGAESRNRGKKSRKAKFRSAQFTKPDPENTRLRQDAFYDHIGPNGLPAIGTLLTDRHVVIGRTNPMPFLAPGAKVSAPEECFKAKATDQSVLMKKNEQGRVVSAAIYDDVKQTAKVLVTSVYPTADVGDKFTSRHAQKGTIGRIAEPEDLPFDPVTGMVPDIIFSPLGVTSRMTMSTMLELFFGKTVCVTGDLLHGIDEQDFEGSLETRIKAMGDALVRAGFARSGKTAMIDGETGEMIHAPIFKGVVAYARLFQLVRNKIHARGTVGRMDPCRQPTEGKARDGGHRFGEMEINILIAHGAWKTLQERLVKASDPFDIYVCRKCNNHCYGNPEIKFYHCDVCGTGENVTPVQISWSTNIVVQELMSQKVQVKFKVEV